MNKIHANTLMAVILAAALIITACGAPPSATLTQVEATATVGVTETPIILTVTPSATPEHPLDTLVICQGQEPDTLYPYGSTMVAAQNIWEAVYDGPIDNRSFGYQPVILQKLPSLADGDALIQTVSVGRDDMVVDSNGDIVPLQPGVLVRPSGCQSEACAVEYTRGAIAMDKMEVTFTLLPGLKWSDGNPLMARDSVYSFNLNADPATPADKFKVERTASYEAMDDLTTLWIGLPGYLDSAYFLNFWQPLPEHIWGEYNAAELVEAEISSRTPMGWGPYVIDEWVEGEYILLHKNRNYFRVGEDLPRFDYLVYKLIGERTSSGRLDIGVILSGECDLLDQSNHLDDQSELLLALENAGQLSATFVTGTVFEHADFGINPVSYDDGYDTAVDRPDFFGDVRTRQAIAMCMDRQEVVDTVMFGESVVLDSFLPPEHPLFNTNVTRYPFDPETAASLLNEVGWVHDGDPATPRVAQDIPNVPDGTLLEFNFWTTTATQRQKATKILAASLAECGVKVNLEYWVSGEYFADGPEGPLFGRKFDMGQFAWLTGVQPPCYLWISEKIPGESDLTVSEVPWLREALGPDADLEAIAFPYGWDGPIGQNNTGYANPEYDAACETALSLFPGQEGYEYYHLEAQRIFAEDLPIIPLYLRLKLAVTRPDFCGFFLDPTARSEMWNIEEFGYGSHCD